MNFRELFASLAIPLFRHKHWIIIKSYSAVALKAINKADSLTSQSTFLLIIPLPRNALKNVWIAFSPFYA